MLLSGAVLVLCASTQSAKAEEGECPVLTRCDLSRVKTGQQVSLALTLTNPGKAPLSELLAGVTYFDGDRELRESSPVRIPVLGAGQAASMTLDAERVEKFSRYEIRLDQDTRRCVYEGTPADALPKLTRTAALPSRNGPGVTVELKGVKWFDRDPLETPGQGGGDFPFLRVAFRRKGESIHPDGRLEIMTFLGEKPLKYLSVRIDDASWARDVGALSSRSLEPGALAYDPLSEELWIGLAPARHEKCTLKIDVTLTVDDGGRWAWKALEKPFRADPRLGEMK